MSSKVTVAARGLSKTYYLGSNGSQRSIFNRKKRTSVKAVRNANFVARAGESIGILGRNGSGKSTLMKLIAGSEDPTAGEVLVSSQPTLLGVSAALQLHLPGAENVRLGLLAMGLQAHQVEEIERSVLDFAELGEAAKRPLKTYSSGMRARLSFAIATAVKREILLIDEALSTGDSTFEGQAEERMSTFLKEAGTVFIVSHAAGAIERYCGRVIWLHQGEIIADGDTEPLCKAYRHWSLSTVREEFEEAERTLEDIRGQYRPKQILFDSEASALLNDV